MQAVAGIRPLMQALAGIREDYMSPLPAYLSPQSTHFPDYFRYSMLPPLHIRVDYALTVHRPISE